MTPQKLFDIFNEYCPLKQKEGVRYKAKNKDTIVVSVPNRGRFEFEWINERKWRFEQID